MASVIPFPPAGGQPVSSLLARLGLLESIESPDEGVMETVATEEQRVLAAIAAAPATGLNDVGDKLATVLRRARANEGFLDDNGLALLASGLADLRHLAGARAFG